MSSRSLAQRLASLQSTSLTGAASSTSTTGNAGAEKLLERRLRDRRANAVQAGQKSVRRAVKQDKSSDFGVLRLSKTPISTVLRPTNAIATHDYPHS